MKTVQFSQGVVPIATFKSQAAAWFERLRKNDNPIVITQNGKPAGVLLSPAEFDHIQEREQFFISVAQGLADAEAGRTMDTKTLRKRLQERRENKRAA